MRPERGKRHNWALLGGLVLVGFGLLQIALCWHAKVSRTWPQTTGTVISHDTSTLWNTKHRRYGPVVEFSYTVSDQRFRGDTVSMPAKEFRTREDALRFCEREYPIGSPTMVYYDPADPSNALLQTEDPAWGLATAFTIAGGIIVLIARRRCQHT